MVMTSAELQNSFRSIDELSDEEPARWDNAAAKIARIQSVAIARIDGSAGLKWWQVSPSHWAVLFTILTVLDLAKGHYVMALISALLAGVDWLFVARRVNAARQAAIAPAQEVLDDADAEITRVLDAAEQYETEEAQHERRVAARALSNRTAALAAGAPPWGPGSMPVESVPERSGQSDAAFWKFVNSQAPTPLPSRATMLLELHNQVSEPPPPSRATTSLELHNLANDSRNELADNALINRYNDKVPARLMMSTNNRAHLALMSRVYQGLELPNTR